MSHTAASPPPDQPSSRGSPSVAQWSFTGVLVCTAWDPECSRAGSGDAAMPSSSKTNTTGEVWEGRQSIPPKISSSIISQICTVHGPGPRPARIGGSRWLEGENRCRMAVVTLLYKRVVLGWKRRPILAGRGKKRSHCCKSAPIIAYRGDHRWTTTGPPLGHNWNTCSTRCFQSANSPQDPTSPITLSGAPILSVARLNRNGLASSKLEKKNKKNVLPSRSLARC